MSAKILTAIAATALTVTSNLTEVSSASLAYKPKGWKQLVEFVQGIFRGVKPPGIPIGKPLPIPRPPVRPIPLPSNPPVQPGEPTTSRPVNNETKPPRRDEIKLPKPPGLVLDTLKSQEFQKNTEQDCSKEADGSQKENCKKL